VVQSILLEMELAALPWDAREASATSGLEAGVIIADDELGAMEATFLERAEEVPPVGLSVAQGDADAEDGSVPGGIDADGDQDGAAEDHAVAANLLVAGIENEVGISDFVERTVAPEIELLVKLSGCATDL